MWTLQWWRTIMDCPKGQSDFVKPFWLIINPGKEVSCDSSMCGSPIESIYVDLLFDLSGRVAGRVWHSNSQEVIKSQISLISLWSIPTERMTLVFGFRSNLYIKRWTKWIIYLSRWWNWGLVGLLYVVFLLSFPCSAVCYHIELQYSRFCCPCSLMILMWLWWWCGFVFYRSD